MPTKPPQQVATEMEFAAAVAQLGDAELRRLERAARALAYGTKYQDPQELLDEAVLRGLIGCSGKPRDGEHGRPWPKGVHIVAFLMKSMQSIANASHHSVEQRVARTAEAIAGDDGEDNDKLHDLDVHRPGVDDELVDRREAEERQATVDADVAAIEAYFANDQEVMALLEGEKEGMSAQNVREMFGMTQTQYDTARRRLRRGLDKLMPGRRRK